MFANDMLVVVFLFLMTTFTTSSPSPSPPGRRYQLLSPVVDDDVRVTQREVPPERIVILNEKREEVRGSRIGLLPEDSHVKLICRTEGGLCLCHSCVFFYPESGVGRKSVSLTIVSSPASPHLP